MPSVRSNLNITRIPSRDGDPVVPVDITSKLNLAKSSRIFGINLASMKAGEVRRDKLVFKLAGPASAGGKCAIAVGSAGTGGNSLPVSVTGIPVNEDVSSLIFLHACAIPSENQKAYFNIPNTFDSADLLGWYEIVYEDEFKVILPVQYGVNILEWNPGGEHSIDRREGDTGSPQNAYSYRADPVVCSAGKTSAPTFFACEWINSRFGKKIKEVNLHGSINYQALQMDYGKPVTEPMKSNAIILAGISKVIKREVIPPKK